MKEMLKYQIIPKIPTIPSKVVYSSYPLRGWIDLVRETIKPGKFKAITEKITNKNFAQKLKNGFCSPIYSINLEIMNICPAIQPINGGTRIIIRSVSIKKGYGYLVTACG